MVGIREAQVENPKPDTKKKMATMIRVLPGDLLSAFLVIDVVTFLAKCKNRILAIFLRSFLQLFPLS
jgi:hypothetical protein